MQDKFYLPGMFLKQLKLHLGSTRFSHPRHILRFKILF
jgi:hypothetical protein